MAQLHQSAELGDLADGSGVRGVGNAGTPPAVFILTLPPNLKRLTVLVHRPVPLSQPRCGCWDGVTETGLGKAADGEDKKEREMEIYRIVM